MDCDIIPLLESVVTIIAIIVGGFWTYWLFIQNREKYPKAKIGHKVETLELDKETLIRLTIEIKNIGKVKLTVKSGEVWLQQIKPIHSEIDKTLKDFKSNNSEKKNDIPWPTIDIRVLKFDENELYELEPAENDHFHFDFVVDQEIEAVQFYTHIENDSKDIDIGWNHTSIHKSIKISHE